MNEREIIMFLNDLILIFVLVPIDITDFGIEKVSCHDMEMKLCYSQPEESKLVKFNGKNSDNGLISFSQPTQIDDLLVSTQFLASQSIASNTVWQNNVNYYFRMSFVYFM